MKYNICAEFDLQDFFLTKIALAKLEGKVDRIQDETDAMFPEKSTGHSVILERNTPCRVEVIASGTPSTPTYSFTVSPSAASLVRKSTDFPEAAEPVSAFTIVWDGLHGHISWNGCHWLVERNEQPVDITLTFPDEYEYKISIFYF